MLQPEIIESNEQLIKAYKWMVGKIPQHEIIEKEGISIIASKTDNLILNPILLSSPLRDEADLEGRLKVVREYINKKSENPWLVIVCEDFLPEAIKSSAKEIFARHELGFFHKMTGMATDAVVPFEKSIPELECRLVESVEMSVAAGEINAIGYHLPLDSFRVLFGREKVWEKSTFFSLGYVEGKPVCTAMAVENEGRLYVVWVATLPEYSNKGYAKKIVSHTVTKAREKWGINSSVLHATEEGFYVYEKLGYSPVSFFQYYTAMNK